MPPMPPLAVVAVMAGNLGSTLEKFVCRSGSNS